MKALWTGSDRIYATEFPKHSKKSKYFYMFAFRIFVKLLDFFAEEHYIVSEHMRAGMPKLKKKISVLADPPKYIMRYDKIQHDTFTILYYRGLGANQKFFNWVYGYDVYKKVRAILPELKYIEVNGSDDMAKIFPVTDFYLRPNRSDGKPRLVMECEINNIPYYHSLNNPDIIEIINKIQHEIQRKA